MGPTYQGNGLMLPYGGRGRRGGGGGPGVLSGPLRRRRRRPRLRYWLFRVLGRVRSGRVTEGETTMASKLYVGGLSYSTTSETLREYFAQCGTVESASVIQHKLSGQSRGIARVER